MLPALSALARSGIGLLLVAGLLGQKPAPQTRAKVPPDPYLAGSAELRDKAGYVAIGEFPFGHEVSTKDVSELLGSEPLIWIETAHFRLGSALPPLPMRAIGEGGDEWVTRTRTELKRLAKRLPKVKPDTKELDPWLRAYLMAQRLEDLYAEVQSVLGVTDADFPASAEDPRLETFRGLGPFLGMPQKFTVLLLQKGSSHARYTRAHHQREIADPIRHHDRTFGCMYWGATLETANALFINDFALHAHLVFNIAHNLYTCYRSFGHEQPAWLVTGLAHWHSRRISPRFPTYDRKHDEDRSQRTAFWEWDKRVPGMMKNDTFEPLEVFLDRNNAGEFGIEQHIQSWAVVEFLMVAHRAALGNFIRICKHPFHARTKAPTEMELRIRQRDAMQTALGVTPAQLEQQWRQSVLGPKARR